MKKYRWLYFLIFSFFIGVFFTLLVYSGLWQKFVLGLQSISWYMWFVYGLLAFYITLIFHELGHFIAFKVQKIKLRALYITIFVFYKTKYGWRFTIKPKLWVLFGGLVVPDLDLIEDDRTYHEIAKKFAISLITAPIVTISLLSLSVIIFIFSIIFSISSLWIGTISIVTFYVILLSTLYIYTFKVSNQNFYGDFVAYKKMKDDEVFRFTQMQQYMTFRVDQDHVFSKYMWEKSKELLKTHKMRHDMIYTMLMTTYVEGILYHNQGMDEEIDQMITKLPITFYLRSEHGLTMAYDLCLYHYKTGRVERAYRLLEIIEKKPSKQIDQDVKVYLNKKAKHVMHIAYDYKFLNNKENIPYGLSWIFEPIVDVYKDIDTLHEPLPFIVYENVVDLSIEPKEDQ